MTGTRLLVDHRGKPIHVDLNKEIDILAANKLPIFQEGKLPFKIPTKFADFYDDFGGIEHDHDRDKKTNLPTKVKQLAPYQIRFANLNYGFMLKGNKVGMTTSELLCDFWTRLLPQYAGFDCLLCASKTEIANDLLMKLKTLVNNSKKYSQFLIKSPEHMDFKEEKSKVGVMYIANPYNPKQKSRIIAIGNSASSVYSRMRVNRIHITDPSRLIIKNQDDYFSGLFSRISNTGGQIKIEGVPGKDRVGWFWKMSKVLFDLEDRFEDSKVGTTHEWSEENNDQEYEIPQSITKIFSAMRVTINDAVKYNVTPASSREKMRDSLPAAEYRRTCMGEFPLSRGAVFEGSIPEGGYPAEQW